jgi:DNA modification methylase
MSKQGDIVTIGDCRIIQGDCLAVMPTLDADSVHSIVTDPPYGLSFMGKDWDHGVPGEHFWRGALRVAKPGAHLLAFGGTRTFHRLAVAIEDAGWEIRDTIGWLYGQGFPKSLDVSKAIDKAAGAVREVMGPSANNRDRSKHQYTSVGNVGSNATITAPATDAARQWDGWGTALKPAWEPIIVARKPLIGTVAANVLQHGTGGINVDGCRVGTEDNLNGGTYSKGATQNRKSQVPRNGIAREFVQPQGRFPANLIHDGSDDVVGLFPVTKSGGGDKRGGCQLFMGGDKRDTPTGHQPNTGSAARFFYCAKASKADRGEGNNHPTIKPTALMRYICRLVTPPGGTVLDPFTGSGSTGKAAVAEGFNFTGIELNADYFAIATERVRKAVEDKQGDMFK